MTLIEKLKKLPKTIIRNDSEYSFSMFWCVEEQACDIEYERYDGAHQCYFVAESCQNE